MSCQQVPTAPAFNPYPRSVQVGEFEVAIGGGIWVAIREPAIFGTLLKRGIELNAHASSDDILTRLVQLNTERTAEEAQGRG